jgi:pyruvate dehydrogenase E2 component (dihydrolipoamide acetyltransferase)
MNIDLVPLKRLSSFRKIAAIAWDHPRDPTIYGTMTIRAEALLDYLKKKREKTEIHVTITHAAARALAIALRRHPELNGIIRFGKIYLRKNVDLFLQVALPSKDKKDLGKVDLSGVKILQADTKSIEEIATEVQEKAMAIRQDKDPEFRKTKKMMFVLPSLLLRFVMRRLEFFQYTLNLNMSWLGMPRDPFGSAMVTSVGMMGIKIGYAPIFPPAHCHLLLLVGEVADEPVVEDGEVKVGKVLYLSGSFDHRMVDGYHAAVLSKDVKELLENPELLDEDPSAPGDKTDVPG